MNHYYFRKSAMRPLYVSRPLLNGDALVKWAKANGFETTVPVDEMHVTVCFSKMPMDWFKPGPTWLEGLEVPAGGPRTLEVLGPKKAVVLRFACDELRWRWERFKECGASWDYEDYKPHVTISHAGGPAEIEQIEPFQDELKFGPEKFAPIQQDWEKKLVEKTA